MIGEWYSIYNTQQLGIPICQEQHAKLKHLSSLGTICPVQPFSSLLPGTARHVHYSLHWEHYALYSPPLSIEIIHRAQHFSLPLGQYFMLYIIPLNRRSTSNMTCFSAVPHVQECTRFISWDQLPIYSFISKRDQHSQYCISLF
jgi:hypothetical protein